MILNETNNIITIREPSSEIGYRVRGGIVSFNKETGELKVSFEARGNYDGDNEGTPSVLVIGTVNWTKHDGASQSKTYSNVWALDDSGTDTDLKINNYNWKRFNLSLDLNNVDTGGGNKGIPFRDFGEVTVEIRGQELGESGDYNGSFKINMDRDIEEKITMIVDRDTTLNTPKYVFTLADLDDIQFIKPEITVNGVKYVDTVKAKTASADNTITGGKIYFMNGRKLDSTNRMPMTQGAGYYAFMQEIEQISIDTSGGTTLPVGEHRYTLNLNCEVI